MGGVGRDSLTAVGPGSCFSSLTDAWLTLSNLWEVWAEQILRTEYKLEGKKNEKQSTKSDMTCLPRSCHLPLFSMIRRTRLCCRNRNIRRASWSCLERYETAAETCNCSTFEHVRNDDSPNSEKCPIKKIKIEKTC